MERQITIPLETALSGIPDLEVVRSISLFGLSNVKAYFDWSADYSAARQEVLNRLQMADLPEGVQPELSPWSALGEIYRYDLVGEEYTTMELKEAQDWILDRQFHQVPGIIDVVGFGGPKKEYHVDLDPARLLAHDISISEVMDAIEQSNANVGGNYLNIGEQSYNIRGLGLFRTNEDIESVLVAIRGGVPVYLSQLGNVGIGSMVPLGKVGRDDRPDVVTGIVMMHRGEQTLPVLKRVTAKVQEINAGGILPPGMQIVPYYDRTDLVQVTTSTVQHVLVAGMVLVGFIMIAFLGNLRAALIVTISIPLALVATFIVMVVRGDSANLISMGALDFGIIVDASVIMVEHIYRRITEQGAQTAGDVRETVMKAGGEVAGPIFFSMAIIIVAFLPLFTMQGVEGRIFGPLAVTYGIALAAALFLSLTYAPALSSWLLKSIDAHKPTLLVRALDRVYAPMIERCLARPKSTLAAGALALLLTIGGEAVTQVVDGERRFDVLVRFLPQYRNSASAIEQIPVSTGSGHIPLKEVATVTSLAGASFIYREANSRYIPIAFSVRGRDLQSTIADAQGRISEQVNLPTGYRLGWAGEFQQLRDALNRLMVVVPVTLLLILFLLYGNFRNMTDTLIVLLSVPPALIGGMLALLITGTDLSISATVGFICVLGVVILNGVVLVGFINSLREQGATLLKAVLEGSRMRLRAVMMVSLAAGVGLLPAAVATGIGSETQQPLAQVVVGSMITAPFVTLLVLPALYVMVYRFKQRRLVQTAA